ncbi:alpha/beta hydrolase [Thalassovita taeanensis]|uniref:alpha/beta hydrolase n=1 Tax=Thalassovita taeanensis TaxID=657014 RepID=UPI0015872FA5|nr:alpha/beta fold hydrolase [Thalassovita taeanensis]
MPEAAELGTVVRTYVASLRAPTDEGWFGPERSETLSFAAVDVAIPPNHVDGKIRVNHRRADPSREFTVTGRQNYGDDGAFRRAISTALKAQSANERDVFIYVHGYNNSFLDGLFRTAQIKHDFDLPGLAVHYSWPSMANPLAYTYDRDSVLFARDGLEHMLKEVAAAGPRRIVLVGHSLGTMLVMETLRQIEIATPGWSDRVLGGVVLISPDLDVEVFKTQAHRMRHLPQPFAIFVSSRDRALQLSGRINGDGQRLGALTDASVLEELPVMLVDVSEFSAQEGGTRHFTVGTSPLLISLLSDSGALSDTFQSDQAGKSGLLPGTVITAKNATQLILSPLLLIN